MTQQDGIGYLFPQPIDPGELACLRIYVPNDNKYIAAFWGAYMFFGTWIAWAKDPLKQGKDVAKVWQRAIDKSRADYDLHKGECMPNITGIRLDPLNACNVQVQFDGAGDWVDTLDLSKCGGGCSTGPSTAQRYNGSSLQQYDPCTKTWQDIGPATDPAQVQTQTGLYPNQDCGNVVAAANLAQVLEDRKNIAAGVFVHGLNIGSTLASILASVSYVVPALDIYAPFWAWMFDVYEWAITNYADMAGFDLYEHLKDILPQYFGPDGSMTQDQFTAMLAEVQTLQDGEANPSGGHSAYGYAYAWLKAAGMANCVAMSNGGMITAADVDCSDQVWTQTFDFTQSDGGWFATASDPGIHAGRYVPGLGWQGVEYQSGGNWYSGIEIGRAFSLTNITEVSMWLTSVDSVSNPYTVGPTTVIKIPASGTHVYNDTSFYATETEITASGTWTNSSVSLGANTGVTSTPPVGGSSLITKVVMSGTGPNPFR